MILHISNSLSGRKELFKPLVSGKVALYVCGVTPYDDSHIGHGRCYVTFDVVYRLLMLLGYKVTYVRNFTDVDDKLLNKAEKELGDRLRYQEIAQKFIDRYTQDITALGCLAPAYEPRVTETIPEIIEFITGLINNNTAYVADGDVYYTINSFDQYGKLSKQKLDELHAGARVQVNDIKQDPLDFALWKSEPEGEFWNSPWGYGRPGWHIECSAMAKKFLGDQIDIHAGGQDLIFPHHENEIAQTEGLTGKQFAQYWMHNAFVQINKEKMSKSLGNFFTLRDVFKQFDPMVIRYYYLTHHYRAPLDFSFDDIVAVQKSYKRLTRVFAGITPESNLQKIMVSDIVKKMLEFLCDDINTPGLLGVLYDSLDEIQSNLQEAQAVKALLVGVLGLTLEPLPEKEVEITPEIQELIDARLAARAAKDWARADQLRDELKKLGVDVQDSKLS